MICHQGRVFKDGGLNIAYNMKIIEPQKGKAVKDEQTQKVVNFVIQFAIHRIHPNRIILFGSRGRERAGKYSDIDLAFEFDPMKDGKQWAAFCINLMEEVPTLLPIDLVNMNEISEKFRAKIIQEGVVVYQKVQK